MTEHMRQARRAVATALLMVLCALAGWIAMDSATASAATPEPEPVCGDWNIRSIVQEWGPPAAGSEVVSASKVKITKPEGGGTEFAAFDLNVTVAAATAVSVKYELGDGAATSAGAVRLFGYAEQDANTLTDAPDWSDVAEADEGTLTFELPAGTLGTLGVVYDASNSAGGHVVFEDMAVGNRPVSFTTCQEPTPSPTVTTPAATTPPATAPPTVAPSATAPPVAGGPSLPVTGVSVWHILGAGAILVALGVMTRLLFRPRRVRTTI